MATWRINNSTLLGGEVLARWQASHTYAVGARCTVLNIYGTGYPLLFFRVFRCSVGGMSGGSEPSPWDTTVGNPTTDNEVTWITEIPSDGNWDNASLMEILGYYPYSPQSAGDTFLISHAHNEAYLGACSIKMYGGTKTNPMKIISVDQATDIPTVGAILKSAVGASASLNIGGDLYSYGVKYIAAGSMYLAYNGGGYDRQVFEMPSANDIALELGVTGGYSYIFISGGHVYLRNASMKFHDSTNYLQIGSGFLRWINGTMICVEYLDKFIGQIAGGGAEIRCVDLSQICPGEDTNVFVWGSSSASEIMFDRCKLPSGAGFTWTTGGAPFSAQSIQDNEVRLYNCSADNTTYRFKTLGIGGSNTEETLHVRTGGASDGTTPFSCKMVSVTRCHDNYYGHGLVSMPILGWLGSALSQMITVECLYDGATALQNDEIWLEIIYFANNTDGLGVLTDSKCLFGAAPEDVVDSAASWDTTGMANPRPFKFSVTIDPGKIGQFEARVVLAKNSTTVYVDPVITASILS